MTKSHQPTGKRREFVLDSSVAMSWFFEDEVSVYAKSVENSLVRSTAVVPSLWYLEIANTLLVGKRRKRTTDAKISEFIGILRTLPIMRDSLSPSSVWTDLLAYADTFNITAYDATYLEVAVRRDLPLATLDTKLAAAAKKAGVKIFAA